MGVFKLHIYASISVNKTLALQPSIYKEAGKPSTKLSNITEKKF